VSSDDPLAEEIDHESAAVLHAEAARQGLPGAAVRYGETLFFLGDHATAEHVLREALARGDEGAHDWLSDVLVATDRPVEAALLMEEHPGRALRAAAIWAQAVDDRERAEKWYRKAVEDDEPGALNDYGSFLSEDDARLEEAEELLRRAAERGDALAYSNLGGMALDRGEPEAAAVWLREGLEIEDQAGSTAVLQLADAEERMGDLDAARVLYDRAVAEDVADAHVARARFLADQDETGAAEADFQVGLARDEEGAHYYYGEFLANRDRADEAVGHLHQAVEDGSDAAHELLALIHQRNRAIQAAEEHFKESIAAGWLSAVYAYAEMLRQEGRGAEVAALAGDAERLGAAPDRLRELTG
jgi:Tfp pilus assembly protein PilF